MIFCLLLLLPCFCTLKGGHFPCTDDCQVTFVNLKCDSSKKRRRGRKSPTKEVSHITAEFEMEMKEEEASGLVLFYSNFPTCTVYLKYRAAFDQGGYHLELQTSIVNC